MSYPVTAHLILIDPLCMDDSDDEGTQRHFPSCDPPVIYFCAGLASYAFAQFASVDAGAIVAVSMMVVDGHWEGILPNCDPMDVVGVEDRPIVGLRWARWWWRIRMSPSDGG